MCKSSGERTCSADSWARPYDVIEKVHYFDKTSRHFTNSKPALGSEKRWTGKHLALGKESEDSDQDVEYDSEGEPEVSSENDTTIQLSTEDLWENEDSVRVLDPSS